MFNSGIPFITVNLENRNRKSIKNHSQKSLLNSRKCLNSLSVYYETLNSDKSFYVDCIKRHYSSFR